MDYYVIDIDDPEDPGCSHESYESARKHATELQREGIRARIFGLLLGWSHYAEEFATTARMV